MDWGVEGGAPTEMMVEAIKAAIPARTRWLGAHGYRQWILRLPRNRQIRRTRAARAARAAAPGCPSWSRGWKRPRTRSGTWETTRSPASPRKSRSAGIALVVSLQRPSYDQMSTSTRASLPSVIALGCHPDDEGFSLPTTGPPRGRPPRTVAQPPAPATATSSRPASPRTATPPGPHRALPRPGRADARGPRGLGCPQRRQAGRSRQSCRVRRRPLVHGTQGEQLHDEEDDMDPEPLIDRKTPTSTRKPNSLSPNRATTHRCSTRAAVSRGPRRRASCSAEALEEFEKAGQMVVGPKGLQRVVRPQQACPARGSLRGSRRRTGRAG